jgi:tetratricopeptide (TPR) repeat protein
MYKKALELNSESLEAVINLAHIAELEGDYYGAVDKYLGAINKNPKAVSPHFCLAVLYDNYDMFEEALAEYAIVLEMDLNHEKAALNSGILWGQIGDYAKAVGMFEKVLKLDPGSSQAHNHLGSIYESMGLPDEAAREYKCSLRLEPLQEDANVNLARIQFLKSRQYPHRAQKEEAIRRLHLVLCISPNNMKAKKLLKEIIGHANRYGCSEWKEECNY